MTKAFVLIKAKSGTEIALLNALFEIPEVQEVHTIVGDYDLMVVMNAREEDFARFPAEKIVEVLTEKIRKMENVLDTKTMIPISSEIKKSHFIDADEFARGFVLLKVKLGREKHVMTEVLKINDVTEVHLITGTYDTLAVLEVRKTALPPHYPEMIAKIVTERISRIKDIQDTETIIPDLSKTKT